MTRRGLALCVLALALLLAGLATRNGTVALLSLPVLAYLAVGLMETPPPDPRLGAERTLDFTRSPGPAAVRVRVRVRNDGASIPFLRLSDPLQGEAALTDGSAERCDSLRQGETTDLSYAFDAPRGVFKWESVRAVTSDPFRLFERQLQVPAAGEMVIRPRVRRFRPFSLSPDQTLRTPGSILGGRAGSGTDFWGVREYQPGDPMRRLDWRRAARHPGQFFTREHEQEEIADIGLILDARAQASLRFQERSLLDSSMEAAASLCEMFLRGGNRVGLVLLESMMNVVYPGYGKTQLYRLLRVLAAVRHGAETSRLSLDHVPLRLFSAHAMIVVISSLTGGEWQLFPRLRARGNEGLLISPDPVDFMKRAAGDEGSRLAVRVARVERRLDLRRVSQLGIRVIDWKVGMPLAPLVRRAMQPVRGRQG